MIWYKAWLESRLRFLIAIALVVALFAFDIAQARIVMPQLGLAPTDFNQFVWTISFTRGAFICALGTLILCPGGLLRENALGTALFTLSLPISRRKWLASRTLVALVEAAIVALMPAVMVPIAAWMIGYLYPPLEELKFSILRFLTGLGMFAFAILCSTLMQSEYGPIAMGFGFVSNWYHRKNRRAERRFQRLHKRSRLRGRVVASHQRLAMARHPGEPCGGSIFSFPCISPPG